MSEATRLYMYRPHMGDQLYIDEGDCGTFRFCERDEATVYPTRTDALKARGRMAAGLRVQQELHAWASIGYEGVNTHGSK